LLSDNSLRKWLYTFQQSVLKSIPAAFEKVPLFIDKTDKWLLTSHVFELVKEEWRQICSNPKVSRHLNKLVSVGRLGSFGVRDEESLGREIVAGILERQASGLQRIILRYDDKTSEDLADFFLNDEVTVVTRAPIYYLEIKSHQSLTLDEGIELVSPFPIPDEFAISMPFAEDMSKIQPSLILEHRWVERKTITELRKGLVGVVLPQIDTPFREFVIALRLLGMVNFKAPFLYTGLLAPGPPLGYRRFYHIPPWQGKSISDVDQLDEEKMNGLQQAWKHLRNILSRSNTEKTRWLTIALERMDMACERDEPMDMLLDLCISLEALLTRETQQVTYQFRQRGTFLLSLACTYLSEGQLRTIRKFLGDAYDMRSRLVHGEPPDTSGVEETNARLFELARIFSLKSIVLSNHLIKDEIISRIDLGMANEKTRRDLEEMLQASDLAPFWNAPYEKVSTLFQDMSVDSVSSESRELT
jgi:hypothetical protein